MKDAYYFSHDSNAKDDPKCVLLIEQLGLEGYGIYWVLIETLRDQPNYKYPLILIPALARRYNTTTEKMKTVISGYELFEVDEKNFFSISLISRMEKFEYKRELARIAGKKSAEKRLLNSGSTAVQPPLNDCSTSKVKESKGKKSIVDKNIYAENVTMAVEEYEKLCNEYGQAGVKRMIEILDNYKGANGKKYQSDYRAILNWVIERWKSEGGKVNKTTIKM